MDQDRTSRPGQQGEKPQDADSTECAGCGAIAEGTPPTWSCSVENGVRQYLCEECARANIRSIEGRLDSSWW